jgi:hypothetical protein
VIKVLVDVIPKIIFIFYFYCASPLTMINFHFVDSQQFEVQMSGQRSWPSFTTEDPNHRVWLTLQISRKIFLLLQLVIECPEKLKSSEFLSSHTAELFPFNNTFYILPLCKISKGNECIAPSIDYMQYDDRTASKSLQRTVWCVTMARKSSYGMSFI